MKSTLYSCLLVAALASCSKKDEPAPAATGPLLGTWHSKILRHTEYDATGKQTQDATTQVAATLYVTPGTITFESVLPNGQTSTEVDQYVRSGETIALTPISGSPSKETTFVRGLTLMKFTFEFDGPRTAGKGYYIENTPFTR